MVHETKKAAKAREQEEAREKLRKLLPPGSMVRSILRHVSRSGMVRHIDFYAFPANSDSGRGGADTYYLSGYIAAALGYRRTRSGALIVGGCGMDMAYHIVHSLSYALHGMTDEGSKAQEAGRNGWCFDPEPGQYRAGYSLRHESL